MWITELGRRLKEHFGEDYAASWAKDFVLPELGGVSVDDALKYIISMGVVVPSDPSSRANSYAGD